MLCPPACCICLIGFSAPLSLTCQPSCLLLAACRLPWPAALRPLTNLRSLRIEALTYDGPEEDQGQVLEALPQLTTLYLYMPRLSPAVAALARLERFAWATEEPAGQLPGGPWLSSLRKVMLPSHIAADNVGVLHQATQLEHLALHAHIAEAAPAVELLDVDLLYFVCLAALPPAARPCGDQ